MDIGGTFQRRTFCYRYCAIYYKEKGAIPPSLNEGCANIFICCVYRYTTYTYTYIGYLHFIIYKAFEEVNRFSFV